jgi:inhibitor of cysteine peptidase
MPRIALFIDEGVDVDEAVTRVTRFELEGNQVSLAAAGEFLGYPLNQFSMDEQNGFLRVTTTTGWGEDTNNRLIILNDNLTIVSTLEKLGKPAERLQSTRFVGDRAYLVTFEMTDPFYVIDVSVPENPIILGELEITGFSSYLQPLDDSHILGIGFEADTEGRTTGLKLAIYDVSDPTTPIENSKSVISYDEFGWSSSSATYNHKDLLVDYDKQLIGFPFNTYNYDEANNTYAYETGYMMYSFAELTLTRLAYITHAPDANYNQMEKGLFLDDYLYTVSTNQVGVSELSNLNELIKLLKTQ